MLLQELETLIQANHILHYHNVLDACGHVSVRHPDKPDVFIMSGDRAPALVSSPSDLIEYYIEDGSPVDPNAKKGYQEKFIHSEIYKRFPHITSVIHSHSEAVLPYTMSGVPMKPTFIFQDSLASSRIQRKVFSLIGSGTHVPIFDILPLYKPGQRQDMLVNNQSFGASLASSLSTPHTHENEETDEIKGKEQLNTAQDHNVVLMTNHGFTAVVINIKQAVYRAIYTHVNAGIQTNAILLHSAAGLSSFGGGGLKFLNEKQVQGSLKINEESQDRPWELWVREVEVCPLYGRQNGK